MLSIIKAGILFAIIVLLFTLFGGILAIILGDPNIIFLLIISACILCGAVYIFSEKAVILMTGAKPIDELLYKEYVVMLEELSIKFKISQPKLYITQNLQSNILSAGRDPGHSVVIITQSSFNLLTRDELLAIFAHEVAHIKNYDSMLGCVSAVLASIILYPAYMKLNRENSKEDARFPFIVDFIMQIFIYLGVFVARFGMVGSRELNADKAVSSVMNIGQVLASALRKISESAKNSPLYSNPVLNSLFIFDPLGGTGEEIPSLFMTHPPLEQRIEFLSK